MSREVLWELGLRSIQELETEDGILASGRDEAYGCVFGRDSLIVAMELLQAHAQSGDPYFVELVEKILRSLSNLQGRYDVIESGEEPGKIVHEYRPSGHEHLTQLAEDPWFMYPEGVMRNYDTVDATPLYLMAVHAYTQVGDAHVVQSLLPSVRAALAWLLQRGDSNGDGFVDYRFHPDRTHGGLRVQSWMDSTESLFSEEAEERPPYPIAPVEVQAYAWYALRAWGDYFSVYEDADDRAWGGVLTTKARDLKHAFNRAYLMGGPRSISLAYALDGEGRQLGAARSSMGHVLWAAYRGECILEGRFIEPLRRRLLARDLFVPQAGIRTLSSRSTRYDPMSYHNGSIWPHDTAMLAEGLENFGYHEDAARVRAALLNAYGHFKTPIELFSYKRGIREYVAPSGHTACRVQAWSAGALLAILK